jgi:hypothetical protein
MGRELVKIALGPEWAFLSRPARLLLAYMAVIALDPVENIERPRLYYAGHDSLAEALFGAHTPGRLRVVRRYIDELERQGAVKQIKAPSPASNAHYLLTLELSQRRTAEVLRSEASPAPNGGPERSYERRTKSDTTADQIGHNGGPERSYRGVDEYQTNHQNQAAASAPQMETVVETEQPTAVGLQSSASSDSKNQLTTRAREASGNDLGIDEKKQDQKRCKHHPCGVYESQHHRLTEFDIEPHDFTWWPDNDSKPDERKRSRRNYAVQNRYQNQKQKTPKTKNP